jgi:hypothetical protein
VKDKEDARWRVAKRPQPLVGDVKLDTVVRLLRRVTTDQPPADEPERLARMRRYEADEAAFTRSLSAKARTLIAEARGEREAVQWARMEIAADRRTLEAETAASLAAPDVLEAVADLLRHAARIVGPARWESVPAAKAEARQRLIDLAAALNAEESGRFAALVAQVNGGS